MKEAPGSPVIVPAQVLVEPMVFGQGKRSPSEVPFAGMESRVTFLPQVLRQGSFFQRKGTQKATGPHLVPLGIPTPVGQPLGEHQAGRVLAGQKGGPGGRADHASRIGIRETNPRRGKLVYVRCFVKLASLAGKIHPAQIIDQEENDVLGLLGPD